MCQRLLVLSTDETFQGPLAVAILSHMAADRCEVAMPGELLLHPLVSVVLEEIGINWIVPGRTSRSLPIDYVVTVSDNTYCPIIMRARTIHWRVRRPYVDGGVSIDALRQVRDQIVTHAKRFVWRELETA